jgi:aspartyl/glutamyl-tRNA(Asn/Gln) amidotransferase C subunit
MSHVHDHRPNDEEVRRLARLAGIDVTEEEAAGLRDDLAGIVDFVSDLPAVAEKGAPPGAAGRPGGRLAEDEPAEGLPRERALSCAPRHDGALILVPRVLPR